MANAQKVSTRFMAKQNENILSVVDIGTAKTVALVAEITDAGLRYRGHGIAASRGSRKGIIVDLDKAVVGVKKAMEEAELTAEVPLDRAVVGVAGPHIRAVNSQGGIALGARRARGFPGRYSSGCRQGAEHSSARRSPNRAPVAPGLHSRSAGWLARSGGNDGPSTRGSRARDHRRHQRRIKTSSP